LRYDHGNTEVEREQFLRIEEGSPSFEIENMAEETLETNVITANCQAKQMPD